MKSVLFVSISQTNSAGLPSLQPYIVQHLLLALAIFFAGSSTFSWVPLPAPSSLYIQVVWHIPLLPLRLLTYQNKPILMLIILLLVLTYEHPSPLLLYHFRFLFLFIERVYIAMILFVLSCLYEMPFFVSNPIPKFPSFDLVSSFFFLCSSKFWYEMYRYGL